MNDNGQEYGCGTAERRTLPRPWSVGLLVACALLLAGCGREPADPQELLAAQSSGVSFLQRGQLFEAERQFKRVVELAPKDPVGHANLGLTYLRNGQYGPAETELRHARKLDRGNKDVAMMLARLYAVTGRTNMALELLREMGDDPRATFALAELEAMNAASGDTVSLRRRVDYLQRTIAAAPGNVAVRVRLAEVQLMLGIVDSAARHLTELIRFRPEPPREARPALDSASRLLSDGRLTDARSAFERFHAAIRLTMPYQAALEDVKWVEGPLVGRPILTFKPQTLITTRGLLPAGRRTEVRFTDVTGEAGLSERGARPTALALGDYDGDGTDNLLIALDRSGTAGPSVRVYNNQGGYVVEVTERTGIALPSGARHATFADLDNDGWLDLVALGLDGQPRVFRNDRSGRFTDATSAARLAAAPDARGIVVADLDHDGDLDLLLTGGEVRLYRNNLDGTFADVTATSGLAGRASDAAFGDVNGDGRVDVVTAGPEGGLFMGSSLGRFERFTADVPDLRGVGVRVADYDNDGWLDVAVIGERGGITLWENAGGRFRRAPAAIAGGFTSAAFVDFDNDGFFDLVAGGAASAMLRNDGRGRFEPTPGLPRLGRAPDTIVPSDADGDGDQDLLIVDSTGVRLLRNDGGNARLAMEVQLLGMRSGGGKNNNFGIGSRIEVRAGELYQTRVVTERVTHFGLGPHLKADVMRVEWTNGVPQTIYIPGTDQDVLELEMLKGSCAFLYTWDGQGFRFVTDVMWRSALGMPLGIMGATGAAYAPAGASQEYLRIPGSALQPRRGRYVLQFTEELWETAYLDQIRLLAVDHPDSVAVFVDERFVPPGPVNLRMYHAVNRRAPRSAVDERGRDVLAALRDHDDVFVGDFTPTRYQGLVAPHELVMDLGPEAGGPNSILLLRGWIYPTDASINVALGQQSQLRSQLPTLEVRNARGEWQVVETLGFPSGKDKTIVVDLAGRFPTTDRRVRIRTNMQVYWNQVSVATDAGDPAARATPVALGAAHLHARGFSRMYRKGGPNGPHWFDYADVTTESPWRPITGAFTRFGNVRPLLEAPDDQYVVMAPGDEATVEFDATSVPPVPAGWQRTFLLYTDGWIKDADLNTAHGNTVEPLPYHAIGQYPYGAGDAYPSDSTRQRYLREYNTRVLRPSSGFRTEEHD